MFARAKTLAQGAFLDNIFGSSFFMLSLGYPRGKCSSKLHHVMRGSLATDAAQKWWSIPLAPGAYITYTSYRNPMRLQHVTFSAHKNNIYIASEIYRAFRPV